LHLITNINSDHDNPLQPPLTNGTISTVYDREWKYNISHLPLGFTGTSGNSSLPQNLCWQQ